MKFSVSMNKFFSIFLFLNLVSIICIAQNETNKRYLIRDLFDSKLYLIDHTGKELANVDLKEYFINGNTEVNSFETSKHNLYLKHKQDKKISSLNKDGIITPLNTEIEGVTILTDTSLFLTKSEEFVISDYKIKSLKTIDKPINFKFLGNGIILAKDNESAEWSICNALFNPIHNIGQEITGLILEYGEGWVLVRKENEDVLLYNINGQKINVSQLMYNKFGTKVDYSRELKVFPVSNNIFLVTVGNTYFKTYYIHINGDMIWKSENLDIKSADSFKNGKAKIERYNTSFEEFIKLKINSQERSYKTITIDTNGKIINESMEKSTQIDIPTITKDDDIAEVENNYETIYSDSHRSVIFANINLTKRYYALIDHEGNVYWENFKR